MSNTDLIVVTRGRIPGGTKGEIESTFRDTYNRFGFKSPYKVEILITETEGIRQDFLREEKSQVGITTVDDEDEVCSHNNWRGFPTVSVSVEKLSQFSKSARKGALRHEAAHTVLHGTLEYSIFRIPDDCQQIASIKGISRPNLEQVVRNLSAAIKDCEVSKFLIANDFIDCQAAFILEWIRLPAIDNSPLKPKMDRQARFVYQTALLKPILLANPLLAMEKSKKIALERQVLLGRKVEELIEHLPEYERNRLVQVAGMISDNLKQDTHQNVDSALHHAMTLA